MALGKDYDLCNFSMLGIWNLWLQWNRRAFKQQPFNLNLDQVVEMQMRELMYCVLKPNMGKDRQVKQVQWLKPTEGWHKLNTDGSIVSINGLSGVADCSKIARDSGLWDLQNPSVLAQVSPQSCGL